MPDDGSVSLAGEELKMKRRGDGRLQPADRKQVDRVRSQFGMVFQSFNLWSHMTVLENVIEGPRACCARAARKPSNRPKRCLRGSDSSTSRSTIRRICRAASSSAWRSRALAMDPKVMLFDEPTSALDPELVGEVLRVMRSLADDGRTMLVVTHEMGFARHVSNRVMFLHEGRVELDDTPEAVFGEQKFERFRQFVSSHQDRSAH
ncbi:ATP-binding cassette domain-containing protein [Candidatus Burkholderia verschuerenii]|uniref:ATP-binding cassette domain-containing protein n=1 Tax=Candidatus Burkholderia verschuerenii TaxID=242163 RepID=UPI000B2DDE94|nr:ATP-binding cassette domain-containing protein [Candidatus Burkholderia verschuerenii]